MSTVLYLDLVSQPCRAVSLFSRLTGLDITEEVVNIGKGDTKTPQFLAMNPFGKVPVLKDGDFVLLESAAILRYLANKFHTPDHWYPADIQARARVDAALAWHHSTIRKGTAGMVWNRVLAQMLGASSRPGNEALAKDAEDALQLALKGLEDYWLAATPFVSGADMSIADLLLVTELEQLSLLVGAEQGPMQEELQAPAPKVRAWRQRVQDCCEPHFSAVHAMLRKVERRAAGMRTDAETPRTSRL